MAMETDSGYHMAQDCERERHVLDAATEPLLMENEDRFTMFPINYEVSESRIACSEGHAISSHSDLRIGIGISSSR